MLGHAEFVDEVLTRKPQLAKELDSRKSSPLHMATAKGCLDIVKRLLQVNPDMCLVRDLDGSNPHIAAIKGHLDVLRELVRARPRAARLLMDEGKTILHACVRYKQLEAMKLLVERVSDHDFVNWKNYEDNTILHLAIAAKQIETINFLISSTTVDVNGQNADGITALDLLSQRDVIDREIVESLRRMGATHAKEKPLSNRQLKAIRTKILLSTSDQSNAILKPKKSKDRKKFVVKLDAGWLERKRNTIMLAASVLAAMAFQAGIIPPSGVWQDTSPCGSSSTASSGSNHTAGISILATNYPIAYNLFIIYNTTGFLASLSIILLLISGLPLKLRFFMWVLMVIMWVAITAMAWAYLVSITALTAAHTAKIVRVAVSIWFSLMLVLLLGHTTRLSMRLIKRLRN